MDSRRILLIEDEEAIFEPLAATLRQEGFDPLVASTAAAGLEAFHRQQPELVLLDVLLPDGDGRDLLREIRKLSRVPVVMLTVRGEELDKVVGLELGADDYVTKPFGSAELIARIRAVLRRTAATANSESPEIEVGDVRLDLATRTVTQRGELRALTLREFELLRMLMSNAGRVVTRAELMDEVWDPSWWGSTKTLDIHVSSLRKKLDDPAAAPRYIHTARGVGFRFSSDEQLSEDSTVSLRAWLLLGAAVTLTVILTGLGIPLARSLERRSVSEFRSEQLGHAGLLAAHIADPVAHAAGAAAESRHPGPQLDRSVAETAREAKARVLVLDAQRHVLADSSNRYDARARLDVARQPELQRALAGQVDSRRRYSATLGEELLLVAVPIVEGGQVVGTLRLSAPLADVMRDVRRTWRDLALGGAGAMAVGLLLTWLLATAVTAPVRRLEEAARRLGIGEPEARTRPGGPREVASLGRSFNRMADALTANAAAQREFLTNAAHQLQTPLTGLRLRIEHIERNGGESAEHAAKARREIERLSLLLTDLAALTRAASVDSATAERVDLAALGRLALERWIETAEREGKTLRQSATPAIVWANADDLEQLLDNLIDNAIRYCPPGTTITIQTARSGTGAILAVADDGPGIAPEDRPRVFERFYRGANGCATSPGSGLGLAIVSALARKWEGEVALNGTSGTRIEARFPSARRPTIQS